MRDITKKIRIISLFFLIQFIPLFSQQPETVPPQSNERIKDKGCGLPIYSDTRFSVDLSGKWEKSFDETEWSYTNIPESHPEERKIFYRRTLKIDRKLVDKYEWQIYFAGIDDHVELYVNGQFVGKYFGGLTPFYVQLPNRMISPGANTFKMILYPSEHAAQQARAQNFFPKKIYTGPIRELFLLGSPQVRISSLKNTISYIRNSKNFKLTAKIGVSAGDIDKLFDSGTIPDSLNIPGTKMNVVRLEGSVVSPRSGQVVARIPSKRLTVEKERTITEKVDIIVNSPDLWSPSNPQMYKLIVKITKNGHLIDERCNNIGFRKVSIKKGENPVISLNGKPFDIKGVTYIEDYWKSGQTLSRDILEKDIALIKNLGANVVRFKYTAPHPYMASLCDKYGIFMLIDLPIYDVPATLLGLDEIKVRLKNITKRFLDAYDMYPSLIGWGIFDGVQDNSEYTNEYAEAITKILRKGSNKFVYKTLLFGTEEINTANVDFISFRPTRKRYSLSNFKSEIARLKGLVKDKPILVCYGLPIQPRNHNGFSDPLSLKSQAHYIRNSYYIARESKLAGSIITDFNDYYLNSPALIINNADQYLYSSGLVSRDRKQRLSFELLRALFNNETEPLLDAGSYKERTPITFIVIGIVMGLILVLLINRFRRFREYLFRSLLRPYNFYADIRDQRIMSSIQTILLGLVISTTVGIFLASVFYFYRTNVLAQYIYTLLVPVNSLQELFYKLVWMPELLMVAMTLLVFVLAALCSLLIRTLALFVRARIFFADAFTIIIWSGVPLILLLPISIVLIRLLVFSPQLNLIVMIILAAAYIWTWLRILKATAIVFDIRPFKVYIGGVLVQVFILALILTYYQYQFSILDYSRYMFENLLRL